MVSDFITTAVPPTCEVIRAGARSHADRPAVIVPDLGSLLTYAELARRIDASVVFLRKSGLSHRVRFVCRGRNGDHY